MQMMLSSFIVVALLMGAWIVFGAAPEVSMLQRLGLSAIPLVVSILITWLAWDDATQKPPKEPNGD